MVQNCGRPMEVKRCITCNANVGGVNHNPLPQNHVFNGGVGGGSERGYCSRSREEEKTMIETHRQLSVLSYRFIWFFLNSALALSATTTTKLARWHDRLSLFATPPNHSVDDFSRQITLDWAILKNLTRRNDDEEISLLVHHIIHTFDFTCAPHHSTQQRDAWEVRFTQHLRCVDAGFIGATIANAGREYSLNAEDEGLSFIHEIKEQGPKSSSFSSSSSSAAASGLWMYRRKFSMEDFTTTFSMDRELAKRFPILDYYLKNGEQLRGTCFLPAVILWQSILLQRFNRTLNDQKVKETTVQDILNQVGEGEKPRWIRAWNGFKEAWNHSWKYVENYECRPIPVEYRKMKMSEDKPIGFSLPTGQDEGICSISLLFYLATIHNQFIEQVYQATRQINAGENKKELKASENKQEIKSRQFTSTHTLSCDVRTEFLPYVEKFCVSHLINGELEYDYGSTEKYLVKMFGYKPLVRVEQPMFQLARDTGSLNLASLKQKVVQESLDKDICQAIVQELQTPANAREVLEHLETCINFLQTTGGADLASLKVHNLSLVQYSSQHLQMTDIDFKSPTITTTVLLKHLESLWKVLRDFTVVNPFLRISQKYKTPLDEKMKTQLRTFAKELDLGEFLAAVKDYMLNSLEEEIIGQNQLLCDALGYLQHDSGEFREFSWFEKFPKGLQNRHCFETYIFLVEINDNRE